MGKLSHQSGEIHDIVQPKRLTKRTKNLVHIYKIYDKSFISFYNLTLKVDFKNRVIHCWALRFIDIHVFACMMMCRYVAA